MCGPREADDVVEGPFGPFLCLYMETLSRTIVKTIVWRILATFITFGVVFTFTGSLGDASVITITAAVLLAFGYYFHERAWDRVVWGRRKRAYSK